MRRTAVDDVESTTFDDGTERHRLSDSLETAAIALNRYRVPPGSGLPGGLHAHADQEEAFVVTEGEATFETLDGEVVVEQSEVIRFAPGEFQSGRNGSDDELVVLAVGAPRESRDVRVPLRCRECGHDELRLRAADGDPELICPACDAAYSPQPCPACGHAEMRVALSKAGKIVAACPDCGGEFEDHI
ncbi:cupin domain-containing protein [Haloprofundus salinisoli]|uniref:cupin domain-containing protein n=1 Tax=Haloprofundus salinisoli TaxID=2876193 RepID=UPI001CCBBD81|nr:cupin domain-containing protein [Haloprofundus salinisoli]